MSDFQWNDGKGGLFQNNKEKPNQPDYRGELTTPDGDQLVVSGWKKQGKKGPWLSLSVEKKGNWQDSASTPSGRQDPPAGGSAESDIPFGPIRGLV